MILLTQEFQIPITKLLILLYSWDATTLIEEFGKGHPKKIKLSVFKYSLNIIHNFIYKFL